MIKIRAMSRGFTLGAACLVWAGAAAAQSGTAPGLDCSEILARAATDPRATVLEGLVGGCGRAGRAVIATVLDRSTDVTDESYFTRLRDVVPRGGSMFAAALSLASNSSATVVGRVGGLRLLATQLLGQGGDLMTRDGAAGLRVEGLACSAQVVGVGDKTILPDDPLPPDYRSRIQSTSERIARETGVDPAVRRAALCLRRYFGPLPPGPIDASAVTLTNVCEREFRVTNHGKNAVTLWYDVAGKPGRTKIGVPVGESFIGAQYPGLVRLYDRDRVISAANSSEKRCPVAPGKP